MNIDELSDRVQALETLNRVLIRYLVRNDVLAGRDIESMMDSLIDQATGDRAGSFHAERLKREIEGETGTEEERENIRAWLRAEGQDLYGYDNPLL